MSARPGSVAEVFRAFLILGLTSFGGPVAHLGYFREAFVVRRRWLDEAAYADIVALCQFMPGPASSQAGMALGILRAGLPGMLAAWIGFTLPSALAMALFAWGVLSFGEGLPQGLLDGLKIVAVAVVAQAVWGMAQGLCPDRPRAGFAVAAAILVLLWPAALGQVAVILAGGLAGALVLRRFASPAAGAAFPVAVPRWLAAAALVLFFALLLGLPVLRELRPASGLALTEAFYRAGSLVFGGGHVVLPLLEEAVVGQGLVGRDAFLAGYGAAQAVPGPLFTFSAYLGYLAGGWGGAALCLAAIFLPSFLLVPALLPLWARLRGAMGLRAAMAGVNAAVVGLLAAALYDPVFTSAVRGPAELAFALAAWAALAVVRLPPWLVVLLCAGLGWGATALTT